MAGGYAMAVISLQIYLRNIICKMQEIFLANKVGLLKILVLFMLFFLEKMHILCTDRKGMGYSVNKKGGGNSSWGRERGSAASLTNSVSNPAALPS
jgi:hypothetical protein